MTSVPAQAAPDSPGRTTPMHIRKTVSQSVREEVDRHERRLLKLEESTTRIACSHKCPNPSLIRLALLRRSAASRTAVKL